jgi:hypothetical protein
VSIQCVAARMIRMPWIVCNLDTCDMHASGRTPPSQPHKRVRLQAAASCCSAAGRHHEALRHLEAAAAVAAGTCDHFGVQLQAARARLALGDVVGASRCLAAATPLAATPFQQAQLVETKRGALQAVQAVIAVP